MPEKKENNDNSTARLIADSTQAILTPKLQQQSRISLTTKRIVDIVGASIFFILLGWLYVVVWWAVIITTGRPAIYRHMRVGHKGKEFACLKFRSMIIESDRILAELLASDAGARQEWEKTHKLRNDPRITRFGHFIRKSSLDELPQFWNVLRGEMSLVGPRPVVRRELEERYGPCSIFYKSIKPGITGPWQISGRSDLSYPERVALDTEYAQNWTIKKDFKILFQTISVALKGKGSY